MCAIIFDQTLPLLGPLLRRDSRAGWRRVLPSHDNRVTKITVEEEELLLYIDSHGIIFFCIASRCAESSRREKRPREFLGICFHEQANIDS